jgi:hypothetical protein
MTNISIDDFESRDPDNDATQSSTPQGRQIDDAEAKEVLSQLGIKSDIHVPVTLPQNGAEPITPRNREERALAFLHNILPPTGF